MYINIQSPFNMVKHTTTEQLKKNKKTIQKTKTQDERFQKAGFDPKFVSPSLKLTKTKIDQRFSKMMTDPAFQLNSTVDRYGRPVQNTKTNSELENYYYQEQDNKKEEEQQELDQEQQEGNKAQNTLQKWMQQYNEESSSYQQSNIQQSVQDFWSQSQEAVQTTSPTPRLALCNYDWMKISSKDLMVLFSSFKPPTGLIHRIQVYLSQYGKERLAEEETLGPTSIWSNDQHIDENKLRAYEKDRLRYYYAVVVCDSPHTADHIYKQCDGAQFQNSNLHFDLRFIPHDTILPTNAIKESCNQAPAKGEVKNFVNRAMGHSKVSLSWQDPQLSVSASLKQINWDHMTNEQLENIDWGTYLDQEHLQQEQNMKLLIRSTPDWKAEARNKQTRKNDIEITFESGFKPTKKQDKKQKKTLKEKRREGEKIKEIKKKNKQHLELMVQNEGDKQFIVDVKDERFKAVYEDPAYNIDPVDPKFDHRKIGNVFKEMVKRKKHRQ